MVGRIVVGTSGWSQFGENWYPPGLPPGDRLAWYAECFEGVEVDSTFYAVPAQRTVARWAGVTPSEFTFDVKLHRLLSRHAAPPSSLPTDLREQAKLTNSGRVALDPQLELALCKRMLEAAGPLRDAGKLSSFLLQLTPAFKPADHRLRELEPLLEALAPERVSIELRHRDWLREGERTIEWFDWPYSEAELPEIAARASDLAKAATHVADVRQRLARPRGGTVDARDPRPDGVTNADRESR